MRTYTDADRVAALARLELNRGNVSKTARDISIPKPTLILWRDKAIEQGSEMALTNPDPQKSDYGQLLADALTEAVSYLRKAIPTMAGRDLAITTGILADKHLDFTVGRKAGALVDQSQHLHMPDGTTLDDIRQLRDGLKA